MASVATRLPLPAMASFQTPHDVPPMSAYHPNPNPAYGRPPPTAPPPTTSHSSTSLAASAASPERFVKPQPGTRPHTAQSNPPPQSPYGTAIEPTSTTDSSGPTSYSQAHPQPPITPMSGSHYTTHPPPSSGSGSYFAVAQTPTDQAIPSPPATGTSRPGSATATTYTPDGVPVVPVGISGGKMFRCRGYGDCDKVFTRSEHLARHVRKHTGERPFPCHCGKAFSRLDNLRQHAATVHAEATGLNDAMLNSLAPVHAALSQRANRDQRKRGEVVEVPKNAVERPRHIEHVHHKRSPGGGPGALRTAPGHISVSPYTPYGETGPATDWSVSAPQPGRPRTQGGYEYYTSVEGQHSAVAPHATPGEDSAGPSRRPASSAGAYPGYPPTYYDPSMRPPTAPMPMPVSSGPELSQVPYPYRPMSSSGRELPMPAHYAGSEPPPTAHSTHSHPPPPTPVYPQSAGPQQTHWTSPHAGYPPTTADPYHSQPQSGTSESYGYPPPPQESVGHSYAPPPPQSSAYGYGTPVQYYPPQPYSQVPPAPFTPGPGGGNSGPASIPGPYPPPPGYAHAPPPPHGHPHPSTTPSQHQHFPPPPGPSPAAPHPSHVAHGTPIAPGAAPPESPFQYHAPQAYGYNAGYYDSRKRRSEEDISAARKYSRNDGPVNPVAAASTSLNDAMGDRNQNQDDSLWLPPTTERRSSLAISALLGSPQQVPRSRPTTAEVTQTAYGNTSYSFGSGGPSAAGNGGGRQHTSSGGGASLPATPLINGTPKTVKSDVKQERGTGPISVLEKA